MYNTGFDISNRIQLVMNELQLTQHQLAKILNITQPAISKYLKGRVPPPAVLLELSNLSGQTIEWFLTGETNLKSKHKQAKEKSESYIVYKTLEEKINILPPDIKKNIENLIDSILQNLK